MAMHDSSFGPSANRVPSHRQAGVGLDPLPLGEPRAPDSVLKPWDFNEVDWQRFQNRFWKVPKRLVNDGTLATLWRTPGSRRGGGAVSSILPVLAIHTWPTKKGSEPGWTAWASLSVRRIARLSGLNKDTVRPALDALAAAGFAQDETRPRGRHSGGTQLFYRLRATLYPTFSERYSEFSAALMYGATWAALPSSAARHLYLVLACLDPIGSEDGYLDAIAERDYHRDNWGYMDPWPDDPADDDEDVQVRLLMSRRANAAVSLRELARYSGLARNTLLAARRVLLAPRWGGESLVQVEHETSNSPGWYVPNNRAGHWRSF